MIEQAINQGCWRGGSKLKLTKGQVEGTTGDPEEDFWNFARKGEIAWICKDCLKNNGTMGKKKECECLEDSEKTTTEKQ